MKKNKTALPERLKLARGLVSQSDVARNLGIPQQTYSRYEGGYSDPPLGLIVEMAHAFGVTSDWLLGLSDVRSGGGVQTPPRDVEVARLWALVESQQRTIEALAKGGGVDSVRAGSSAGSQGRREVSA